MNQIKVFQREIDDGIAEAVRSQASLAYCTSAKIVKPSTEEESLGNRLKAENQDQIDLYYLECILVSTNWNGNDDVFLPENTWAARNTPEDKPFNYMHDQNDIIGHITGSYVVGRDGNRIEANTDTPPNDFDIITRVVLYTSWADEENRERMKQIIADLEGDEEKWFVSMECLFSGFDYAVVDAKGEQYVLPRDEATAFLTSHLRSYGGEGIYEGYKIGRAIKNISFSGEGLVDNPANKRSVIFKKSKSVAFDANRTVSKIQLEDINMADVNLEALKSELAEAKREIEANKAQMEEAKKQEIEAQIAAHKADIEAKDGIIADLKETISTTEAKVVELEASLAASEKALSESDEEKEKMKKEKKDKERKTALIDAGIETAKVDETLASLADLTDEAFAVIVDLYNSKQAEASSSEEDNGSAEADEDDDDGSAEADALEGTEANETLPKGDTGSDVDTAKAKVAEFLAASIG